MPAPSRAQQQLIIGEVAWIVLDLYAASIARARSMESAGGHGASRGTVGGEMLLQGRRRDDRPAPGEHAAGP
jgi:hypothetical protein